MHENLIQPSFILKGVNYLRYLFAFILIATIVLGIYAVHLIGNIMLIVIVAAIIGLFSIRFPYLYFFEDHFVIKKKRILEKCSHNEIYYYNEIRDIAFVKGQMNWPQLLFQTLLGQGSLGGFSRPDQMILKLKNDKVRILHRFGSKKNFLEMINQLQKRINP